MNNNHCFVSVITPSEINTYPENIINRMATEEDGDKKYLINKDKLSFPINESCPNGVILAVALSIDNKVRVHSIEMRSHSFGEGDTIVFAEGKLTIVFTEGDLLVGD